MRRIWVEYVVQVKKIEDVVYDLSLRNLVPHGTAAT